MTARAVFTTGFSRRYTGGVREFMVEAKNLRGVIKAMDRLYPGLGHHLEEETTGAIDETAYFQPIPEGYEHPQTRRGQHLQNRVSLVSISLKSAPATVARRGSPTESSGGY